MQKNRNNWEQDLRQSPVRNRNSSTEMIMQRVGERIMTTKNSRNMKWIPLIGSIAAVAVLLAVFLPPSNLLHVFLPERNQTEGNQQTNPSKDPVTKPDPNQNGNQNTVNQTDTQNTTVPKENPQKELITHMLELARVGKVINCEFAADTTTIENVEKKWGKPDKVDAAGQGLYATYENRGIAFGINRGDLIFDVRSYDPTIKKITLADVKQVLGQPQETRSYPGQQILVYYAGKAFELQMIFPLSTQANPNPQLDHISVFCPRDAVNLATQEH